jgi:hypothetical protein
MMAASDADAPDAAVEPDTGAAGAAAASTRDAVGLDDIADAVFATPALPCKAIALRRIKANSRPERVAVAVLSVVSAITYLDINGFVEVAIA